MPDPTQPASNSPGFCRWCGEQRTVADFKIHPGSGKPRTQCNQCRLAFYKKWREKNRDKTRRNTKNWIAKNRHKIKEYSLRQRYGITPERLKRMEADQHGLCQICEQPMPLCVDHRHDDGKVRGLLCRPCNSLVGHLENHNGVAERAVLYLEDYA
jgi:hypothetical protein